MSSPHSDVRLTVMSLRGLILWAIFGALGLAGLAALDVADAPVMTLENSLGSDVETTRL